MNASIVNAVWFAGFLIGVPAVLAQKAESASSKLPENILVIRQKAEAGNVAAQLAIADKYLTHRRPADGLNWLRRASEKGSVEANYRIGNLLLFGATSATDDQRVSTNPAEGVRYTYYAATNLHPQACRNMALALQKGLGVAPNAVEAYAWLQTASQKISVATTRSELENLALRLTTQDLERGQNLARQFKNHNWPKLNQPQQHGDVALDLGGILMGGPVPLATINHQTVAVGESARITVGKSAVQIKCLEIAKDVVTVQVGNDAPRQLRFANEIAE